MAQQVEAQLQLPAQALPALAEGVKAWRAALLILEPWVDAQARSVDQMRLKRLIWQWKQLVTLAEHQVIAGKT